MIRWESEPASKSSPSEVVSAPKTTASNSTTGTSDSIAGLTNLMTLLGRHPPPAFPVAKGGEPRSRERILRQCDDLGWLRPPVAYPLLHRFRRLESLIEMKNDFGPVRDEPFFRNGGISNGPIFSREILVVRDRGKAVQKGSLPGEN